MIFWNNNQDLEIVNVGSMDPHGLAILKHVKTGTEQYFNCYFDASKSASMMLTSTMYIKPSKPQLEVIDRVISHCGGKVLDVGAGGGAAALKLQDIGFDVTAIDLSEYCVEAMHLMGIKTCVQGDIRTFNCGKYDTLIMLDSVLASGGTLEGVKELLKHLHSLLTHGGQILIHEGTPQPGVRVYEWSGYFKFENYVGSSFKWCNINRERLSELALATNWSVEFPYEDDIEGRYIAKLVAL